MARYIDADKIPYYLNISEEAPIEGRQIAFKSDIEKIPTADVAPRVEVAREIFEEIFNIIKAYEFDALIAQESYGVFQVRNFGAEILRLKKKYTEGEK